MKHKLLLLLLPLLFASCATIINKPSYKMAISSNAPNASVKIYDSVYTLPAKVMVKRSKDSLLVQLISDTLTKDYKIKAINDRLTTAGNIAALGIFSLVAIHVDRKNERGFYYKRSLFLDINDTLPLTRSERLALPIRKGRIALSLSIPYINSFCLQPEGEGIKGSTGFLGISAGLEYYYRDDRFLKLNSSGVIDFLAPLPAPISGEYEAMSSFTTSLTNNHRWKRFTIGYGPSWQENVWREIGDEYKNNDPRRGFAKRSHSFGVTTNAYYQLGKAFHVGLIYSPSFYSVHPNSEFLYQHVISIDMMWKIPLYK